jgi:hypothetical protein
VTQFRPEVSRPAHGAADDAVIDGDFKPVSYGFRPRRRAQDAIAEIHFYGACSYRWVLDADIAACFDEIGRAALMDRVRNRIADKRVLALVKAFLKAGLLTELGEVQDTFAGTPQGASCPRCWPTSLCRCSMSTCTRRGRAAGSCPPATGANSTGPGVLPSCWLVR